MQEKAAKALGEIAAESLEKCVSRLSRVSSGRWRVAGSAVSCRSMAEAVKEHSVRAAGESAGVYFDISGDFPFSSMVMFKTEDAEIYSRGFLGASFERFRNLGQAQELLFSELGNIILNSLAAAMSKATGRPLIPSVPKCVRGETQFLLEALWSSMGAPGKRNMLTVTLDLSCCGSVTQAELIVLIPEALEAALSGE
ncbi:MAG: hypothetical protein M0011_12860 [Elusimicrobia bacterium]|nr:hypothetical protein [Elusimicrobiota bacterium]